jgi:hypothetical protein
MKERIFSPFCPHLNLSSRAKIISIRARFVAGALEL